jgi:HEAT repeat protein
MDTQQFLTDIQGGNADARFAAWRAAGEVSPSVIPQLGKLAASETPGVAKAAQEALATMTHAVGKDPKAANRPAVIKGLLEISGAAYALPVRAHAFRFLSNIAAEDSVPAIAREMQNPDLREEVAYCLERIPGDAAIQALTAAYQGAADEFKPRILAALGHRRAASALTLVINAMRSTNQEIAVAAVKAFGRIGAKAPAPPPLPSEGGLSEWQKVEVRDGLLRYADAQAKAGNTSEALGIYRAALDRPEEHWQCAGIVGVAAIGTPEAAALILPKLKSQNRTVRITAQNAWKGIASG